MKKNKQLPVLRRTPLEAEAMAFAQDCIAKVSTPGDFGLDLSALHPDFGHAWLRQLLKMLAMTHPFKMTEIIRDARAGWQDADLALRELIAEILDRGDPLPAQLRAYTIESLHPNFPRLSGPQKVSNLFQDIFLTMLIWRLLARFPLSLEHNPYSRRPSACSIAAEAFTEARLGRSIREKAAAAIYRRWSVGDPNPKDFKHLVS